MQNFYQRMVRIDAASGLELLSLVYREILALGFSCTLLVLLKPRSTSLNDIFMHGSAPTSWLEDYKRKRYFCADPLMLHCLQKHRPLVWSPDSFTCAQLQEIYACSGVLGIPSGIAMPIHSSVGEKGMLNCVADGKNRRSREDAFASTMPKLLLLRDLALDALGMCAGLSMMERRPTLRRRELECLQWHAVGKTSWEIGRILHISEACVNFHFNKIREKFGVSRRQDAVSPAIAMGLIKNPLEWSVSEQSARYQSETETMQHSTFEY